MDNAPTYNLFGQTGSVDFTDVFRLAQSEQDEKQTTPPVYRQPRAIIGSASLFSPVYRSPASVWQTLDDDVISSRYTEYTSPPRRSQYGAGSTPHTSMFVQAGSDTSNPAATFSPRKASQSATTTRGPSVTSPGRFPDSPISVCVFCKTNGERLSQYGSHVLKDASGRVTCPVLRRYTCPICGASGDTAHTVKYCPLNAALWGHRQQLPLKTVPLSK